MKIFENVGSTFLENSSHFSSLLPIRWAHEVPRTWWLSRSSSCAAMKQQSLLTSLTGTMWLDVKASMTFARQPLECGSSLGQPQERPGVSLSAVSEGSGRDRTAAGAARSGFE